MFNLLDVGCGNVALAKGDVNVDFFREGQNRQIGVQNVGELVNPHLIKNFVVADACHLPFKDGAFNVVFSSHSIEHVADPFMMHSEMARVAVRKVIVRCPHRRGAGAKRPFHLCYLDEDWFASAQKRLGFKGVSFVRGYEPLCSSSFHVPSWFAKSIPWRAIRKADRRFGIKRPFELESWLIKQNHNSVLDELHFYVVTNDYATLNSCFLSSPYISGTGPFSVYDNSLAHESLPVVMNRFVENYLKKSKIDCWMVFCHQDFILKENLRVILAGKNVNAVYGVTGCRDSSGKLFGRITQTDGSFNGDMLIEPTPVQTLDELCLIVHSSLFRRGLRFDERFKFHFYGADLCMQAYVSGFDVYALQVNCQHKSKSLSGAVNSQGYREQLKLFAQKWRCLLPIKTTTKTVSEVYC